MDKWLAEKYAKLAEENTFSDCRVLIGRTTFDCHKIVLGSASEFFERMFLGSFKEAEMPVITLNNVKIETFEKFRLYTYTYDKTDLEQYDNNTLIDLLEIGNKWLVKSLATDCVDIVTNRIETMILNDLMKLFQCAHNIVHNPLIEKVTQVLKSKYGPNLNCSKSLNLAFDAFEQYLIMSEGYLTEICRFELVDDYIKFHDLYVPKEDVLTDTTDRAIKSSKDNLKIDQEADYIEKLKPKPTCADKLLAHINFKNMTKNQFYNGPGKSSLFNINEKYELLYLTKQEEEEEEDYE